MREILDRWVAVNPVARLLVYVVAGVVLGAVLIMLRVPDIAVRFAVLAIGAGLVTSGVVHWTRRRTRVKVLSTRTELPHDGECRYCGRPASGSVGYTRRRGGRILTCAAHVHLAVAEATR
jgi:hypothetical protein